MPPIIDSPYNLGSVALRLFNEGVRTVIRYYNSSNSQKFPEKCLTKAEANKLAAGGLTLCVVYQQRGGASSDSAGNIEDFAPAMATRDARMALQRAAEIGQPEGSAIYFGVDHDFYLQRDLTVLKAYFATIKSALAGRYRVGVYGSGTVCGMLKAAGTAELFWLPKSSGWSGSRAFLASGQWTLFQNAQDLHPDWGNFDYDANQFNPAFADFGQFRPGSGGIGTTPQTPPVAIFEIVASEGLNLRAGPGTDFPVRWSVDARTLVNGLRIEGQWTQVDATGDGLADGFMKSSFLRSVSGGLPITNAAPVSAYDVAMAELALDVREVAGAQDNPRIVMYHATTAGGPAPDETAWCSSFVNYCVSQSGMIGINDKWARSWHDRHWGQDCTDAPRSGDIVVWRRRRAGTDGGHVAFFVEDLGDRIRVLGGNQSNRVCLATFPKAGTVGTTRYDLLSIRR